MDYFHHDIPRRQIGGLVGIYCRKCGREIARAAQAQFRSVSKCQICLLLEQGVKNPEEYVLPQYLQLDPTKPPVPLNADDAEYLYEVFPEERPQEGEDIPLTGVMGTVKSAFKVIGLFKDIIAERKKTVTKSRKVADKRGKSTLFD